MAHAAAPGDEVGIRFDNREGVGASGHGRDKVEEVGKEDTEGHGQ